jgi:hypothetical protein
VTLKKELKTAPQNGKTKAHAIRAKKVMQEEEEEEEEEEEDSSAV